MSNSQSPDPSSSTKTIRDFLYVDEDQVNSLASQIFGGVAESIVESSAAEREHETKQQDKPSSGRETTRRDLEGSHRSERRVMYDRVYSRLERALDETIFEPSDLHHETVHTNIEPGNYIRARGETFFEDHAILGEIFANWTRIADALVAAQLADEVGFSAQENLEARRKKLKELIEEAEGTEKSKFKRKLESLPSSIEVLKDQLEQDLGMHKQEDWLEEHLHFFNKLFYGDSSSFSLVRDQDEEVAFRMPINGEHLRISEHRIRTLHNGSWIGSWTVVGKATFVPNRYRERPTIQPGGESENMRDQFRGMAGATQDVYDKIYRSENVSEVVISPIAIYQETSVEVENSTSE